MRAQIEKYRKQEPAGLRDYTIGCILLSQPFFLPEESWIPVPSDWSPNIVQGKTYDLTVEPGLTLYRQLHERLAVPALVREEMAALEKPVQKYGAPVEVLPRLGQGIFRVVILDGYNRSCANTGEKACPPSDEHRWSCPRVASPLGSDLLAVMVANRGFPMRRIREWGSFPSSTPPISSHTPRRERTIPAMAFSSAAICIRSSIWDT
jgi:hypothetical protein